MMRRSMAAALMALMMLAPPVEAQVASDALTPYVGKYTETPGGGRFNAYVTTTSGLLATWYFGGGCSVNPFPCDPSNGSVGNMPGGLATAALWRMQDGELIGDVLSTNQADVVDIGPIRARFTVDSQLILIQGEKTRVLDRVR